MDPDDDQDALVDSTVGELRRLVDEFAERYRAGDYAAALSSLAAVPAVHEPLAHHVNGRWLTANMRPTPPETSGMYL